MFEINVLWEHLCKNASCSHRQRLRK